MELRTYISILIARRWIVITTLFVALMVVAIGTYFTTPMYEASTTLRVATAARGGIDWVDYDLLYTDRLMNTYLNIIETESVLQELGTRLGVDEAPQLDASIMANTELMLITARDEDPTLAADAANTAALILIEQNSRLSREESKSEEWNEQLKQLETELTDLRLAYERILEQSPQDTERLSEFNQTLEIKRGIYATMLENYNQYRVLEARQLDTLSVIEPATIPIAPATPNLLLNLILGVFVGSIGGVGLAFFFENLDTRFRTNQQIEAFTGLTALGSIPTAKGHKQANFMNGASAEGEAFRHLRTNILSFAHEETLKSLMVTSAQPGEGKSTVVASLALALSYVGLRIVVVDCDLRHPTMHKLFEVSNEVGLSNLLKKTVPLYDAVQPSPISTVSLLPSGPLSDPEWRLLGPQQIITKLKPHPAEMLSTPHMASILSELNERFDLVLIDTPPASAVTDAAILAPLVDGVILVVSRKHARKEAVQAVRNQLANVHANLIGVVINQAESSTIYTDYINY